MNTERKPDLSLDLRGEHCPYNAIATLETLRTMQPGQLLEVVTDCSQSFHGIPEDATRHGYHCLAVEQHGPHLPLSVDLTLADGVVAAALGDFAGCLGAGRLALRLLAAP